MHSQRFQRGYVPIFLSYYKPHLKLFILDMACALGIALVDLAFPWASRQALNELLPQSLYAAFFTVMGILLAAYALRSVMYFVVTYWGHMMGVRIEADIRRDLFGHMQDLSFSFYDKNRTGQLMSRATNDLFEITELAHHGPEDLFISAVTLIGAFCLMLTIQWKLALIVFAVVPIFIVFTIVQRRRMIEQEGIAVNRAQMEAMPEQPESMKPALIAFPGRNLFLLQNLRSFHPAFQRQYASVSLQGQKGIIQSGAGHIQIVGSLKYDLLLPVLGVRQKLGPFRHMNPRYGILHQPQKHCCAGGFCRKQRHAQEIHELRVVSVQHLVTAADIVFHLSREQLRDHGADVRILPVKMPFRHIRRGQFPDALLYVHGGPAVDLPFIQTVRFHIILVHRPLPQVLHSDKRERSGGPPPGCF